MLFFKVSETIADTTTAGRDTSRTIQHSLRVLSISEAIIPIIETIRHGIPIKKITLRIPMTDSFTLVITISLSASLQFVSAMASISSCLICQLSYIFQFYHIPSRARTDGYFDKKISQTGSRHLTDNYSLHLLRYNIFMNKKKTILDELVAGLGGILLVVLSFGGYTIFSILAYGVTEQKTKNLQSLTPLFFFVLISFITALAIRDSKRKKHEIAKAVSEKNAHLAERAKKYRQFYNLPEDIQLYHYGDIFSTYPTYATAHEQAIAKKLIDSNTFSPNCIFLDSYFKTKSGKTVQVDIIAVETGRICYRIKRLLWLDLWKW